MRKGIKLDKNQKELIYRIVEEKDDYGKPKVKPKVYLKAYVIYLRSKGKSIKETMDEVHLSRRTILYYTKSFFENKNDYLNRKRYKISSLEKVLTKIKKMFKNDPPETYKEASNRIAIKLDIKLSESATRAFLNKHKIYSNNSKKR